MSKDKTISALPYHYHSHYPSLNALDSDSHSTTPPSQTITLKEPSQTITLKEPRSTRSRYSQYKSIDVLTVYMLERFLEKEFKEKFNISNPKLEQDFIESIQNIIIYMNLKLINYNDIAIEYGEIKEVNKTVIKDGVFIYDIEKYPVSCKKIRRSSLSNKERANSKLKRILAGHYPR